MLVDILTLFPRMVEAPLEEGVIGRAMEEGVVTVRVRNVRDYARDRHRVTDDVPYGGGGGMVMKPEPLFAAVEHALSDSPGGARVILMSPQGRRFNAGEARDLAGCLHLVLVCGRYEGVDERVRQHLVTDEISIGDYVLTGGEIPALVVIDAVLRFVPGVVGSADAAARDSFSDGLLEGPHYTRPRCFRGMEVPEVLLSGDHERIRRWRRKESLRRTLLRRPDLLDSIERPPGLDRAERRGQGAPRRGRPGGGRCVEPASADARNPPYPCFALSPVL